jgi:hypothetical protein
VICQQKRKVSASSSSKVSEVIGLEGVKIAGKGTHIHTLAFNHDVDRIKHASLALERLQLVEQRHQALCNLGNLRVQKKQERSTQWSVSVLETTIRLFCSEGQERREPGETYVGSEDDRIELPEVHALPEGDSSRQPDARIRRRSAICDEIQQRLPRET